VTVGIVTRTGSAVAIALGGPAPTATFLGRLEIELAPAHLPAQPYHAAARLDVRAASALIAVVEQAAEDAAGAGLRALTDGLPAAAAAIAAVAVVVKPVSLPDDVADVLRSHARMHAAEGVLYREAVLAAVRRCGWTAVAVDESYLPAGGEALAVIGRDAGRPWRRIEKDAARAALTLLSSGLLSALGTPAALHCFLRGCCD
jgi:hypothetical protein